MPLFLHGMSLLNYYELQEVFKFVYFISAANMYYRVLPLRGQYLKDPS